MLKRLINLFTGSNDSSKSSVVPASQHHISSKQISQAAHKVIHRLMDSNYQAFLVGGGVRDLLLEGSPKDFDVATNATPEQVRKLFRNSRIIGRRFRIVHVRFGREIIEVTTFRNDHTDDKDNNASKSEDGMLLRDNVFGDIETDARRRDFTINALYYNPHSGDIFDYTGGFEDIHHKTLRIIGDPVTRFKEDPVRMLRAVRFSSKLNFDIEPKTSAPISEQAQSISQVSSARLWDESLKLFMSGYSTSIYQQLIDFGLFKTLFPGSFEQIQNNPQVHTFFENAMRNTDRRIQSGKRVTPAFIYAVLLWPEIQDRQKQLIADRVPPLEASHQAYQQVLSRQIQLISIPKRFSTTMREIWDLQARLPKRAGQRALRTLEHAKFRAAYDFLLLREQSGEDHHGLGQWWTDFQNADPVAREKMADAQHRQRKNRPNKRRPRRKNTSIQTQENS